MKYIIGIILACLLIFPLSACSEQPTSQSEGDLSSQGSETVSQEEMSKEEYEILQGMFTYNFQQYMTQLQSALSTYNGSEDWWNSFQSLADQAKGVWDQFQANQQNIPESCQEAYQKLSIGVNNYLTAIDTVRQAKDLGGVDQQQKLAEASQLFIQANTQWQNTSENVS